MVRILQPLDSNASILGEVAYDSLSLLDLDRDFAGMMEGDMRVVKFLKNARISWAGAVLSTE